MGYVIIKPASFHAKSDLESSLSTVYNYLICATVAVKLGERDGSVVECRTPEREVRGSKPT